MDFRALRGLECPGPESEGQGQTRKLGLGGKGTAPSEQLLVSPPPPTGWSGATGRKGERGDLGVTVLFLFFPHQ